MFPEWQLQDAKAKFSEMVKHAVHDGPQMVTVRGEQTVVLLSVAEFNKLMKHTSSLVQFMQRSPLKGLKLDLSRDQSGTREDADL